MLPFFNAPEHDAIRAATRRFVETELTPNAARWDDEGIPRSAFEAVGAMGFIGARYPQSIGGTGGDLLSALPVVEEISRCRNGGFVTSYLVQAHICTPVIQHLGTLEHFEEFLRPALAGKQIGCLAVTEPDAGSDVAGIRTTARRVGGDWLLNGSKMYITNAGVADFAVVAAKSDTGPAHASISLFLVDTHQPGFKPSKPLNKLGLRASNTAGIALDDVRVPARNLLGEEGRGFRYIMTGFQEERLVSSIYAYVSAMQAIEDTIAYLSERRAFGAPLAERQAIRHTLAQLAAELEAVRQLCYAAAWRINRGIDATREVSMCKLLSAEIANRVAYQAMQFHGGYGYMEECPIARYYRSAVFSIGVLATPERDAGGLLSVCRHDPLAAAQGRDAACAAPGSFRDGCGRCRRIRSPRSRRRARRGCRSRRERLSPHRHGWRRCRPHRRRQHVERSRQGCRRAWTPASAC